MTQDLYAIWDAKKSPPADPRPAAPPPTRPATSWATRALETEAATVAATTEGSRNAQLNVAAFNLGQIVAGGHLDPTTVTQALTAAARIAGLGDHETANTIASGLAGGAQHPRHPPLRLSDTAPTISTFDPDTVAKDFWTARPTLTHIRTFAQARRAAPWATLGVVLAQIVTHTSHHIVLPPLVGGEASLNLFIAIVGPSGAGKGAAMHAGNDALDYGLTAHATISLGSGEGIAHCFARRVKGEVERTNWKVLADIPEIDSLTALGNRQGATLMPELRKAFMGERLGFAYADPAKRLPIDPHTYRFCVIAGVQPGRASGLLDDADGGTPQRFIWLPATDPQAPTTAPPEPPATRWNKTYHDPIEPDTATRTRLTLPAQVRTEIDDARLARLQGHNPDARLDGHLGLTRLKAAAALMLLDGRRDMNLEDWQLAGTLIDVSNATRTHIQNALAAAAQEANHGRAEGEATRAILVHDRLEEAATQRVARGLVRALNRAGDTGLSGAETRKSAQAKDRIHVDTALDALVTAGTVTRVETAHGTRYTITEGP